MTRRIIKTEPQKTIELKHNQCFEGDLIITFPIQDSQQSPIILKSPKFNVYRSVSDFENFIAKAKNDKTGETYKQLVNCIYFNPNAHKELFSIHCNADIRKIEGFKEKKNYSLIKIDKDGTITIDSLSLNFEYPENYYTHYILKISRSNLICNRMALRIPKTDAPKFTNNHISALIPGSDTTNYDKVKFEIGKFSIFDGPKGSPFIPTFKNICFSTLKQLFSINKENTLKNIKSLPFDLKSQFIEYCLQEERPIGHNIIREMYNDKEIPESDKEKLFTLDVLISSTLARDTWQRENPFFEEEYVDTKINVYDNFELFKYKRLSKESDIKHRLFTSENKSNDLVDGSASIVSKEEFLNNFHRETRGLFKDEHGNVPKNFLFYGGLITSCLTGQTKGFEGSDIDVLMLKDENGNFSEDQYIEKVKNIFGEDFEDNGYSVHAMGGHIVFSLQYPNRTVQFNVHEFDGIEDVLLGADIDCSCFAFDGTNVWTLERGLLSLNHRINIASQFSYRVRGGDQYQRRLLKYLSRGFDIHYHNTTGIEDIVNNFDTTDQSKMSEYMSGFQLLLAAKYSKSIETTLNLSTKDRTLPYGPKWKKENFDRYMNTCFENIFDGYSSSGVYCPVESIDDLFQFRESTTETLGVQGHNWEMLTPPERFPIIKNEKLDDEERFLEIPPIEDFINLNENDELNVPSKSVRTE
ncbi:hypothetical protein RB653_000589 [Dictyostelium firmibasis]|uniref:Uncharacterized protein n=1 Tax=Dictyostelium firmibasis TaxID=79012 RepID=A0AAN7TVD6_9MYCE